jgi:hypothetical protein
MGFTAKAELLMPVWISGARSNVTHFLAQELPTCPHARAMKSNGCACAEREEIRDDASRLSVIQKRGVSDDQIFRFMVFPIAFHLRN